MTSAVICENLSTLLDLASEHLGLRMYAKVLFVPPNLSSSSPLTPLFPLTNMIFTLLSRDPTYAIKCHDQADVIESICNPQNKIHCYLYHNLLLYEYSEVTY